MKPTPAVPPPDARLLVRETLRISADLASSPAVLITVNAATVESGGLKSEVSNLGLVERQFVDSSLRLICSEEIDGRRWNYFADDNGGSEKTKKKRFGKGSIRAVSMQAPQAPIDELMSFIRSYVVPEGSPDSVVPSYVPYMSWRALKHLFGGAMGVFTTQTLLSSVGFSRNTAAQGAVAINWILKVE